MHRFGGGAATTSPQLLLAWITSISGHHLLCLALEDMDDSLEANSSGTNALVQLQSVRKLRAPQCCLQKAGVNPVLSTAHVLMITLWEVGLLRVKPSLAKSINGWYYITSSAKTLKDDRTKT